MNVDLKKAEVIMENYVISKSRYLELTDFDSDPCISIYISMNKDERGQYDENRILFKNAINEAKNRLEAAGYDRAQISDLLDEFDDYLEKDTFWAHQNNGLAIFINAHIRRMIPLSVLDIEGSEIIVSNRFWLRPLLTELSGRSKGYILALSQNQAKLYQTNGDELSSVEVVDLPSSLDEALKFDLHQSQLQSHGGGSAGDGGAIFHGHHPKDDRKDNLRRYCLQIDTALTDYFNSQLDLSESDMPPLIFAGTEEIVSSFVNHADLPVTVLEKTIEGNVEGWADHKLNEHAQKILAENLVKRHAELINEFNELKHQSLTAETVEDVVRAAHFGQIERLFVSTTQRVFGKFDLNSGEVSVHNSEDKDETAVELLDLAVWATLENGGSVVPFDQVGEVGSPISATLRYSIEA